MGTLAFAGTSSEGLGLGNSDNQENIFAVLSGPVLGSLGIIMSFAVLISALASLQSTAVSPARTLLAMGYYKALGPKFASISPKYQSPSYATIASCLIATLFCALGYHLRFEFDGLFILRRDGICLCMVFSKGGLLIRL